MGHRQTVAVDVDGVIHSYTSGWQGPDVLPDPPVLGAIAWLEEITKTYDVAIFSTRAATERGRQAIHAYLEDNGLSMTAHRRITIGASKPPALIYLDDRAYRFEGNNWPTVEQIKAAKPWNKK